MKEKAQHFQYQSICVDLSCWWDSVVVVGVTGRGVRGVLPWLFLSLHCTGCESRAATSPPIKTGWQMTVGLETQRGKLRCFKNATRIGLKNETVALPYSHLWSQLDQQKIGKNCLNLKCGATVLKCIWSPIFLLTY